MFALIVAGGALYSLGGLVYGSKRPNPSHVVRLPRGVPRLTIAAFVVHYVGVSMVVYGHR